MTSEKIKEFRRIAREFLITAFLLGSALALAILSSALLRTGDYQIVVATTILSLILAFVGGIYSVPKLSRRISLRFFSSIKLSYSATPEMAFFFILTVIVGFSAINTGNNLLYLVFSVLIAVLIVSGVISESSLRNIDVSLRFPEHIFATEETLLELSLINRKRILPSFSLTVGVVTKDEKEKKWSVRIRELFTGPQIEKGFNKLAHYAILPGGAKVSQRLAYTFKKRGSYQITGFMVSTKFPFGFLRKTYEREAIGEVVVYPLPQAIGDFSTSVPVLAGWLESSKRGNSSDLYRLRQYVPNDNMRHIHWKATAKSRRLMVKEFTDEDERRFTLILDDYYNKDLENFAGSFERAVVLMASLADYFSKQGSEIRLFTPKQQTDFGLGIEHLYKILRILAFIQPDKHPTHTKKEETKSLAELIEIGESDDFKIVVTGSQIVINNPKIKVISLGNL
ncbi:MAG: DUF58 domain-containing protein [Acidobacteria bacterium]|nr:DUF58 domain-containing protein [Acidobacteriota bacterium]